MISDMKRIAARIGSARSMLVLTGAGISTASGIPDFRGKAGLYMANPADILSSSYFFQHPDRFYEFVLHHIYFPGAEPNDAHKILAKWEQEGRIRQIVTQNIDGLHQAAGSQNVIEFHGTLRRSVCQNCGCVYAPDKLLKRRDSRKDFYVCDSCDGDPALRLIKPDVVLYGEMGHWLAGKPFRMIQEMAYDADLILVLGTTLEVSPFNWIPQSRNQDKDTQMVIVNQGSTPYDNLHWVHAIRQDISRTLSEIDGMLHDG